MFGGRPTLGEIYGDYVLHLQEWLVWLVNTCARQFNAKSSVMPEVYWWMTQYQVEDIV